MSVSVFIQELMKMSAQAGVVVDLVSIVNLQIYFPIACNKSLGIQHEAFLYFLTISLFIPVSCSSRCNPWNLHMRYCNDRMIDNNTPDCVSASAISFRLMQRYKL